MVFPVILYDRLFDICDWRLAVRRLASSCGSPVVLVLSQTRDNELGTNLSEVEGLTSWYGHLNSTSCKFSTSPPPTSLSPHRVRNRVFHLWWISRSRGRTRPELIRDSVFSPIGSRRVERSNLRNPRNGRLSAGMTPPGKISSCKARRSLDAS